MLDVMNIRMLGGSENGILRSPECEDAQCPEYWDTQCPEYQDA